MQLAFRSWTVRYINACCLGECFQDSQACLSTPWLKSAGVTREMIVQIKWWSIRSMTWSMKVCAIAFVVVVFSTNALSNVALYPDIITQNSGTSSRSLSGRRSRLIERPFQPLGNTWFSENDRLEKRTNWKNTDVDLVYRLLLRNSCIEQIRPSLCRTDAWLISHSGPKVNRLRLIRKRVILPSNKMRSSL